VFGDAPLTLGVIGSGEEAREGLRAACAAASVKKVFIYSPTAANRERFAHEFGSELGVDVVPVASAQEAVADADAAYVATAATSPVIGYDDVAALELVVAVGATQRIHRELTGELVAAARAVVVDCTDAARDAGEMVEAAEDHGWDPQRAVLLGNWLDRPAEPGDGPLLFKSIGSVEQDLALALALLEAAAEQGRGRVVEPIASARTMR
jgi:ornithine cyclodeaminase/alanine dehydrogenase-like protein (mu-crystallin family)